MYFCNGDTWQPLKGENGEDGKSKKGEPGNAGSSCSAKKVTKNKLTGYVLTCGKEVVDTLWNGKDGSKGAAGADGADCKVASDKGGVITLSCGEGDDAKTTELYKAVCGTTPYDPAEKFCFEDKLEKLCKGKAYNPSNETCKDGKVVPTCGGETYDTSKKFCYEGKIEDLCGGESFDIATQYCLNLNGTETVEALLIDDRDAKHTRVYKTVKIGEQTWMAENLNYGDSDAMPNLNGSTWCGGSESDATNEDDCAKFGRLYTWTAAINMPESECGYNRTGFCNLGSGPIQGVCPDGWHLPDTTEWVDLFNAVGGANTAGKMLKSTNGWNNNNNESGNGEDSYGFTALPAGDYNEWDSFGNKGYKARFWSSVASTEKEAAYFMELLWKDESADLNDYEQFYGFSVRCIQDAAN